MIRNLQQVVQQNCDIADAHHASDFSLCVYLLKMREYYRWETGKTYSDKLSKNNISKWLCHKETTWETLEDMDLQSIEINNTCYDPYDADQINLEIVKHEYIYSSGLGLNCRPHFFLGTLLEHIEVDGHSIYISGTELARDLPAPPAFSIDNSIFIRKESVKRMVWEKIDEWRLETNHNTAFEKVFSKYDTDKELDKSLDAICDNEIAAMILHEQGELHAQKILGSDWQKMLANLPRSPAHFMVRAVRDHIADCYKTLPELFKQNNTESIHFYFGNFNSIRKKIFPVLIDYYQQWLKTNNTAPLLTLTDSAFQHWSQLGLDLIHCWKKFGENSAPYIEELVKQKSLNKAPLTSDTLSNKYE